MCNRMVKDIFLKMMIRSLLLVSTLLIGTSFAQRQTNNVCDDPFSYTFKQSSPRCRYNPDQNALMPELVTQHGFSVKSYDVITEDGYILRVFNIPRENPEGVVFLLHPATSWSNLWVDKGNVSLGLYLSKAGYDVWMGNLRGTLYSRRHVTLNPDKDYLQFWNFTFHEMGEYDMPAQIDLVVRETNAKQVAVVGHSMAGLVSAIYASLRKEHAETNVRKFILMAPAVLMQYFNAILTALGWIARIYYEIVQSTPLTEILAHNSLVYELAQLFCNAGTLGVVTCQEFLGLFSGGRHFNIIDWEQAPIMWGQAFAGMSAKTISHYAQFLGRSDQKLPFFDYGKQVNREYYNSDDPPFYPLESINSSIHIIAGTFDMFATMKDCQNFYNILRKNSRAEQTFDTRKCGHIDFVYANNLMKQINEPILKILDSLRSN